MEVENKYTQTIDSKEDNVKELKKWKILKDLPKCLLSQVQYVMVARRLNKNEWYGYAFLVTRDDQVYVIGDNKDGQLGLDREIRTVDVATKLGALSGFGVIGFSCSSRHVAAWTNDGKLFLMGDNRGGALGQGHCRPLTGPQQVSKGLGAEKVIKAVCGSTVTLCLTEAGNVYSWGASAINYAPKDRFLESTPLRIIFPTIGIVIQDVACCISTSFALSTDGKLYGWGSNACGQVGIGSTAYMVLNPTEVHIPDGNAIKAIACGHSHCLVLTQDGSLFGWGRNGFGEVGNGNKEIVLSPIRINIRSEVMGIATCNALSTSFCKTWSGSVWSWGRSAQSVEPVCVKFANISDFMAHKDIGMCETWVSDDIKPALEPDLKTYFIQSTNVEFEVEGKRIMASKFFLKRCQVFRNNLQHEWKQGLSWSGVIPIDGFSFDAFKAFIHFLHTDNIVAEEKDFKELLKIARVYAMESFYVSVLNLIKKKITITNAVKYYIEAMDAKDDALELVALDFIKAHATAILANADISSIEATVVKTLMQDIIAMGAFKSH